MTKNIGINVTNLGSNVKTSFYFLSRAKQSSRRTQKKLMKILNVDLLCLNYNITFH
jgi:hypothetical protein